MPSLNGNVIIGQENNTFKTLKFHRVPSNFLKILNNNPLQRWIFPKNKIWE